MRKFIVKFRYYLALFFVITTISNVVLVPNLFELTNEATTISLNGIWLVEGE